MRKITEKQKRWITAKTKKIHRKRHKDNKKSKRNNKGAVTPSLSHKKYRQHDRERVITAPEKLSIFLNPVDTLRFFKRVSDNMKQIKSHGTIYFDLSKVEIVSVDAIMYIIATIKNTKRLKALKIKCAGSLPKNEAARNVFESTGFYEYLTPQYQVKPVVNNDHINITRGQDAVPALAGQICQFVHAHSKHDRISTKSLFTMIIELMTNTKQHAYTNNTYMENNWYIYVEDCEKYLSFVFLDTGAGIPNTIRTKGIIEKLKNMLNADDSFFIASALRGELRSETKLDYRGKGLPEIFERVSNGYITDFSIVSGYGECSVTHEGEITQTNLTSDLAGTLLCWKLLKNKGED